MGSSFVQNIRMTGGGEVMPEHGKVSMFRSCVERCMVIRRESGKQADRKRIMSGIIGTTDTAPYGSDTCSLAKVEDAHTWFRALLHLLRVLTHPSRSWKH